jgi:hypothetical protein
LTNKWGQIWHVWYKKYWAFWGKKEKLPTDTGIRNTGRFGGIKKNYPPILV